MRNILLLKYGEIAIRGKNRYIAENRLVRTIIKNLEPYEGYKVYKEQGRLLLLNEKHDFDYDTVIPIMLKILGVTAVCPGVEIEDNSIENLRQQALNHFREHYPDGGVSFKVTTKRADKKYPLTSNEVSMDVGGYVFDNIPNLTVDVHNPDVNLMIEIRNNTYIYSSVIKGQGGLPYGSGGKATVLMSGGIDSPVAAYLIARRGVEIEVCYFDSPPYTSERAKQKVIDLAAKLSEFTGGIKLHIVPFTDVQLRIYEGTPPEKMTILLKRAMLKSAEKIARANNSRVLVTGDSVAQVASQTIEAISAIDPAADMPVLRPLCTMDKQDIIDIAIKLGTYDISIRPYEDCCTIFVAKHPEIRPKRSIIESIESNIQDLDNLIDEAVRNTQIIEL